MQTKSSCSYEQDIIQWAKQQAELLRSGNFSALDIEHIAEEIEDVGKSEQRELASRMAVLITHLLKWQYQSERRGASWQLTIKNQRKSVGRRIEKTPSLKTSLKDPDWIDDVWDDACLQATKETGIGRAIFPESCPWSMDKVICDEFWPD